jgi:hypothetical protein
MAVLRALWSFGNGDFEAHDCNGHMKMAVIFKYHMSILEKSPPQG